MPSDLTQKRDEWRTVLWRSLVWRESERLCRDANFEMAFAWCLGVYQVVNGRSGIFQVKGEMHKTEKSQRTGPIISVMWLEPVQGKEKGPK